MSIIKNVTAAVLSIFMLASCGTQISSGRLDIKAGVDSSGNPTISLETGFDLTGPGDREAGPKASAPGEDAAATSAWDDGTKIGTSLKLSTTKAATMALVIQVAREEGIDPLDFLALAWTESALDPTARAKGSSAKGVMQFVDRTAAAYGLADPFDAAANIRAGARLWKDNAAHLKRSLDRTPTGDELYLAHMQGAGTAAALIKGGTTPAAKVSGRAAIALNLPADAPKHPTAEEFVAVWKAKFLKNRGLFFAT
jgi:hypothetical protein